MGLKSDRIMETSNFRFILEETLPRRLKNLFDLWRFRITEVRIIEVRIIEDLL